ncbi:hypothetical protein B0H14DRAFT_2612968 [Mycena olivaceomarginata]|nr:hypothetical protein B0H14DRAFT_2612968 [Mycena olivaceomarginata]
MEKCSVPQTDSPRFSAKLSIGKEEHAVRASMFTKTLHIFESALRRLNIFFGLWVSYSLFNALHPYSGIFHDHYMGQRDFAAAVLLPHAAAVAAALQRQYAVVVLAVHVELLGIAVTSGFKGVGALYCN